MKMYFSEKEFSPDDIGYALMCCLGKHKEINQDVFSPDIVFSISAALEDLKKKIDNDSVSDNYKILYDLLNAITQFEIM